MPDVPNLPYRNLAHALHRATSAHAKVHEGIATHAEKEKARREEREHRAKMSSPLTPITVAGAEDVSAPDS